MRKYNIILILFLVFGFSACTEDFVEINTDPNAITGSEASAMGLWPSIKPIEWIGSALKTRESSALSPTSVVSLEAGGTRSSLCRPGTPSLGDG